MKRKSAFTASAVLIIAGAAATWWWTSRDEVGKLEYRTAKIERGTVTAVVAASGTINPVQSVQISSQVSGQLKEVLVDYNSEVRQGQVLARIDPETFRLRVNQSQADLDAAQSQVLVQESQVSQRRAEISRVEVNLGEARRDLARKEELIARNFISIAERDRVMAQLRVQDEDLKTARAGLAIAIAQVKNSEALVKQRQAALESARVDLERTVIRSPVDGIVIKRAVDAGETVAASLQAPTMFLIARNLRDMQVDTSIDESDITRIRSDQKATFTVDAFPARTFQGVVTQVRKAAQNVQNVVTYIVVVTFSNSDGALQPGMTANVRVVTEVREDVFKVANAALRFRLPGEGASAAAAASSESAPAGVAASPAVAPAAGAVNDTAAPGGRRPEVGATRAGAPESSARAAANPTSAPPASGPGSGGAEGASTRAGSAGGSGGLLAAFRERIQQELAPTPEQGQKLDAIFAAARDKYIALRELPEEQRAGLAATYRAEMRAAVAGVLDPQQKTRYEAMLRELAARAGASAGTAAAPTGAGSAERAVPVMPKSAGAGANAVPGAAPGGGRGLAAAAGAAPGGPLAAFRARLEQELTLSPGQQRQLDTIFAGIREKYIGLRAIPEEQRGKLGQSYRAELRALVGDVLTPEQKKRYEGILVELTGRSGAGGRARIYVLENGKPRAVSVRTGISDGSATEVSGADLAEGMEVIIGIVGKPGAARPEGKPLPRLL